MGKTGSAATVAFHLVFIVVIASLLFCAGTASAQSERTSKNAIYVELLGNGLFYTFNYDRLLTDDLCLRAGIGVTQHDFLFSDFTLTMIPVTLCYIAGSGAHGLEMGGGFIVGTGFDEDEDLAGGVLGTATIGYRFQQMGTGLIFRIGFTPIFIFASDDDDDELFHPWGGLSLGVTF